jgi:hypothetical protein
MNISGRRQALPPGTVKMNEFVAQCGRDRIHGLPRYPIDGGHRRCRTARPGQSPLFHRTNGRSMMLVVLRKGRAHYVSGRSHGQQSQRLYARHGHHRDLRHMAKRPAALLGVWSWKRQRKRSAGRQDECLAQQYTTSPAGVLRQTARDEIVRYDIRQYPAASPTASIRTPFHRLSIT